MYNNYLLTIIIINDDDTNNDDDDDNWQQVKVTWWCVKSLACSGVGEQRKTEECLETHGNDC